MNLGAEYLSRPIEHVLATLMHEMVHIYCMENGIKDTSNAGRYHNKSFKAEAERRGLKISKAGYIGWSVTEPTEEFIQNIQDWELDAACENSVRATKDVNILCMDCNVQMIKVP